MKPAEFKQLRSTLSKAHVSAHFLEAEQLDYIIEISQRRITELKDEQKRITRDGSIDSIIKHNFSIV
jgi:hypothetical protein